MPRQTDYFAVELGGRSALLPMDAAIAYLRQRWWRVLPPYLVGMSLYCVVVLMAIDVATSQHRRAMMPVCLLLTAATFWRWGWLAVVQRRVQQDIRGDPPLSLGPRLGAIILARLYANFAIVWGGVVVVPAYYGFFVSGFATPMILDRDERLWPQIRQTVVWTHNASGRLGKVLLVLAVALLLLMLSTLVIHQLLVQTILPSLLGLDTADLALTMGSWSWLFSIGYFLFVLFDLYWAVLSVMLFYDLQSRRFGTGLRVRLTALGGIES